MKQSHRIGFAAAVYSTKRGITERSCVPGRVAAFMSANSKTPYMEKSAFLMAACVNSGSCANQKDPVSLTR